MDSRVEELTDTYVVEMMEIHLANLREESEELKNCNQTILGITAEVTDLVNSLDKADRELLRKYKDALYEEESICFKGLYLAGLKDGIQLLKSLKLI